MMQILVFNNSTISTPDTKIAPKVFASAWYIFGYLYLHMKVTFGTIFGILILKNEVIVHSVGYS